MKQFLIDRLHEGSTWRGIVMFAAAMFGFDGMSPEQAEGVVQFVFAASGLIGMAWPEKS